MRIRIAWDWGEAFACLNDTPSAQAVFAALPMQTTASISDHEVYLGAILRVKPEEDARRAIQPGMIGYWIEGASIMLPFGSCSASVAKEGRRGSRYNMLGQLETDPGVLASIRTGHLLTVTPVPEGH